MRYRAQTEASDLIRSEGITLRIEITATKSYQTRWQGLALQTRSEQSVLV